MAKNNQNTRGLDTLEKDILILRKKARQLEEKIDENFTYFQHHSGSMFVRSLLPRKIQGEIVTDNPVLDAFLQNEKLQKILARLADRLAEKLGNGLNWLADKVFKKD
jgi:hypothetical protein